MSRDALYIETATISRRLPFLRRAFSTALAEADVNYQTAATLANHSELKTHMRYVMNTRAMRQIPSAAK
jgi:hypothetical protein